MKAAILFTGSGPILILTSYESLTDPALIDKLETKGIRKFIAYEVSENRIRRRYGKKVDQVMNDLKQQDDLRVLDYDGHHVFYNFSFETMGQPIYFEKEEAAT